MVFTCLASFTHLIYFLSPFLVNLIDNQDFLAYLKVQSETKGVTIVYATHIFDGLDDWATHIGEKA